MTYLLEQWHIDRLTERKRKFGWTFTRQIRDAVNKFGHVAENSEKKNFLQNCHLVRFSIDADFGKSSPSLRKILSAALTEPDPEIDKEAMKKEIRKLDSMIQEYLSNFGRMEYIVEEKENA